LISLRDARSGLKIGGWLLADAGCRWSLEAVS